jgi:hypothetical protein
MYLCARALNKSKPTKNDLEGLNVELISDDLIKESIETVVVIYEAMGGTNTIAKGQEFVNEVLIQLNEKLT